MQSMQVLKIEGKDAADFLHRVSAGRVKPLEPGQGAGNVLLNGQSRMIAQFDLLRLGPDTFLAVCPGTAEPLRAGLDALLFSEDVTLSFAPLPVGIFPLARNTPRGEVFKVEGALPSVVWPSPVPGYAHMSGAAGGGEPEKFAFDRIGAGVPWPPADWDDSTPALEAGVLPWIDRHKGCYPGQEVVERSLNVGHPARVLISVEGDRLPENVSPFRVLSVAGHGGTVRALLRAPWNQRENPPAGFRLLQGWEPK